ncbi:octopamine receptor beta-3R [Biomphalaria pfeifferi]|uniref:Octopamine receptor beta-3R n=1 Tax=Biomphalaria pfeifferi TaxID=112525 RepID=A0AAD8EWK0_BIOPF|nr:octopamine receptor beta-3R [Biomphalaria pfeifferi]
MDLQNSTVCHTSSKIIGSNHVLVALSVLLVILAASTFFGNGAVLVAMVQTIRKQQNDFHRSNSHGSHVTKFLMLSMTVSGVVVGALLMPLALLEFISNGSWTFGMFWLKFRVCADYLICCITSFHISFMAIDTYLLVCKPLLYRLLTRKSGYVMIASGWVLPTGIMILWCVIQPDSLGHCQDYATNCSYSTSLRSLNLIIGSLYFALLATVWVLYTLVFRQVLTFNKQKLTGNTKINKSPSEAIFAVFLTADNPEVNRGRKTQYEAESRNKLKSKRHKTQLKLKCRNKNILLVH